MAMEFTYDVGADGQGNHRGLRKVVCSWTSDGSGNASGDTLKLVGELVKATTNPTDGPTANYDISLTDDDGVDILANCDASLANRHTTTSEEVYFLVKEQRPVVCGIITVAITNAGATKSGVLNLFLRG